MNQLIAIFSIFFFLTAPTSSAQGPSERLAADVDSVIQITDRAGPSPASLEAAADELLARIPQLKVDDYVKADFSGALESLVPRLAQRRMRLRGLLAELHQRGALRAETASKVRDAMRLLRGMEDYLGFVASGSVSVPVAPKHEVRSLLSHRQPTEVNSLLPRQGTMVNLDYIRRYLRDPNQLQLRSGDLLLSRGDAATSSAIARLGNEDTQFSHIGMVYVDPKTGKVYTIEAHIEQGVLAAPIEEWFADGKKRTAIYRFHDPEVAQLAGERMYELVTRYQKEHNGENIPYDFGFDMHDSSEIFCSEVVTVAFGLATDGAVRVPMFPAKLTPKNRAFLDQLGIRQTESFIPADIDIDPRFELLAEWRDFGGMRESWISDAITTKIYEWMENEGLKYSPPPLLDLAGSALVTLRRAGACGDLLRKRVAPNVEPETVSVMLTIVQLYKKVHRELLKREAVLLAGRGRPLTFFEALEQLELLRKEKPAFFSRVLKPDTRTGKK